MLLLLVTKYEQNPNKPIRNHSQKLCLGFKLATAVTTNKKTQGLQASGFGIWMFTLLKKQCACCRSIPNLSACASLNWIGDMA
jgi:hypothetical protein